ncbi:MAG: M14 family zinc carboxypeptidase, partial [Thermoanaerobaculia bacterium]|nr:M14 family zinc carboxypeptidase [Thermoanaerobaculia bacterium]
MPRALAFLIVVVLLCVPAGASEEFDFFTDGPYRDGVPTPSEFLGYEAGELHTHHFRMEDYFEALAAAVPERMRLFPYGESYEKKRLFYAVVTSEGNLDALEEIRLSNLALADPRATSAAEAAAIASEQPVVVWLDYGNDGNETANIEAAMHVAYQLVAGESEEMQRLRRRAVVVIEPDHNPESHDRHVTWYNAFGIGDPDPLAMEHDAPWGMSTNNNHYQ